MHSEDTKVCGIVTVGPKGQIVIPADARDALGLRPGQKVIVVCKDGKLIITSVESIDTFIAQMTSLRDTIQSKHKKDN
jgi:AbrB family looped-hinge helix DNA binding protein